MIHRKKNDLLYNVCQSFLPRETYFTCNALLHCAEFRSCVKAEVAVLGSPSLIVLMVSVDVKQH